MTKTAYIRNFGCQMNVYDGERMAEALALDGYAQTADARAADVIILNTCHIREKAAEKVYSELGRLKRLKRREDGPAPLIGVAGCVAQAEGEQIIRRQPAVDFVLGPQTVHRLAAVVARAEHGVRVVDTEFPDEDKFEHLPQRHGRAVTARGASAFLTVQEGCDKFCAFCVVPYTRGAEVSRPHAAILAEARQLVAAGVREITLLGQNVNAYRGATPQGREGDLAGLLHALAEIDGLERLRYTTSHPRDMSDALIVAHRDIGKLMPYLHLPVQSGADAVLAAMNRKHTATHYLRLVDRIRRARPDIALSGDFIVGFPGETDTDFEATLGLVREVGYASAFSFKYSPRPGTPAAGRRDQVPELIKAERLQRLQSELRASQAAFNAGCIGRTLPVLLEKPGRRPGQLAGRSPYLQPVHLDAPAERLGDIVEIVIERAGANSLSGALAGETARSRPGDDHGGPAFSATPPNHGSARQPMHGTAA